MKKLVFTLLLMLIALGASAQFPTIKVGGGLSSHYSDSKWIGAYKIGVGYEYELSGNLTVEPALEFYAKGWKDPEQTVYVRDKSGAVVTDETTGLPVTGVKDVSSTAYYVEVPIVLSYYIPTNMRQYVKLSAGPYVAYGVGGNMKVRGDTDKTGVEQLYYSEKTFDELGTHRFDAGIRLMVGYEFNRNINCGIETDLGLTKFNAGSRNVSLLLSFTYRFRPAAPSPLVL